MNGFAPSDKNGNYKRPKGLVFDNNFNLNFNANEFLYLLIGSACPWCHRALIVTELNNLSDIQKIYLKPNLKNGEWIFNKKFYGHKTLTELYKKLNKKNVLRATLPILLRYRRNKLEVISNESSEIVELLNLSSDILQGKRINIESCDKNLLNKIHNEINNGVYKCGFARNQESYVNASNQLFQSLKEIDEIIKKSNGSWVLGNKLTLADIYLFPTIIRWELIYSKLFKCTEKEISEFKNIVTWRNHFFYLEGIEETCCEKDWTNDYYKGLFTLNPNQIVPLQPKLKDIL
ncbi:MAG: glutathione-dependent reductase [Prochlorococcus sp. SP3034]|nr:glutathione-dependent reductase [Prochlorococcus sp. SP3034]